MPLNIAISVSNTLNLNFHLFTLIIPYLYALNKRKCYDKRTNFG
nr:MAG TPA: hypothetical protein [Bacteriophage sp.]